MLFVELFSQADQEIVILDRVSDCGKLFRDLSLLKEIGDFGPIILVLCTKSIGQATRVVLKLPLGLGISG